MSKGSIQNLKPYQDLGQEVQPIIQRKKKTELRDRFWNGGIDFFKLDFSPSNFLACYVSLKASKCFIIIYFSFLINGDFFS